jgi:hypothetical protein
MRNLLVSSAILGAGLLVHASDAHAGGSPGSLGVGAEFTLLGMGGASINFDQGDFHVGGFLGIYDDDAGPNDIDIVEVGARFFYHLHSTAMSDFSIGGQIGFRQMSIEDADDDTDFTIDLGAQIRAFVASNVAISATIGIGVFSDNDDGGNDFVVLTGDLVGIAGIHYYFF